jgi:ABC-type antimicrobial peptide transport system permease subunit
MDRFITGVAAGFHAPPPGDLFIRFRPGLDPTPAIQALTARLGGIQKVIITAPTQPTDVANFGQVENLPQVLAGLLAALGAGTMGYLMVSAVRRRRRELAILKTLGFVPAQISAAVAWQATTVAAVALLIGVPAGIIGGRAVWTAVADQIGVVVSPQVPWLPITAVVAVAAVLANIVAAGPAAVAARISASSALRDQ